MRDEGCDQKDRVVVPREGYPPDVSRDAEDVHGEDYLVDWHCGTVSLKSPITVMFDPYSNPQLYLRRSAHVDNATMLHRIDEVKKLMHEHQDELLRLHEEHIKILQGQTEQLSKINNRLVMQGQTFLNIFTLMKTTSAALFELKDMLGRCAQLSVSLQTLASNPMFFRSLDPTRNMPVVFEDALGNVLEIPLDWLHNWGVGNPLDLNGAAWLV